MRKPREYRAHMYLIILALIGMAWPDIYIDQPLHFAWFILPVLAYWALRYLSLPLVATAAYFIWRSIYPDENHPEMGFFATKDLVMWGMAFGLAAIARLPWDWRYGSSLLSGMTLCGYPILFNESLNQALIVALLPFSGLTGWLLALLLLTFKSSGLSALVMLPIVAWPIYRRRPWLWICGMVVGVAKLGARPSYWLAKFQPEDRLDMYRWSVDYFWKHIDPWIGGGLGSFQLYGIYIQRAYTNIATRPSQDWWLSLHQDWLQLLLETGIVGVALAAWLVGYTLRKLPLAERLCGIALLACSMGYFPLHVPLIQVLIAWLVLKANRTSTSSPSAA